MGEKILSPGVFQNESDQSLVQRGIQGTATAIVGPTVLGQPLVPTYVTSYSEFVSKFGETFKSGSYYYEYLTSLAVRDFFGAGGQTLLVTRIISGSANVSTYASSSLASVATLTEGTASTATLNLTNAAAAQYSASINGTYTLSLSGSSVQDVYNRLTGSAAYSAISSSVVSASFATPTLTFTAIPKGTVGNNYYYTSGSATVFFTGGVDVNSFALETISWGNQMNNSGSIIAGALASGSATNVRWEITSVNTGSGTFNLAVRAGNDNTAQPNYIETFPNLSLDPALPNFISRVVGDLKPVYRVDSDGVPFVDFTGSYANASQFVRVKSILTPNVDSIDNNGAFKSGSYSGSLPLVGSGSYGGSFAGGVAATTAVQLMNENITTTNIQGFAPADYVAAFNLLSNKDEYQFNVLLAPGITLDNSAVSTMISTCEGRGDAIAMVDCKTYGSTVTGATTAAAGQSSNYAATYWPWIQLQSTALGKAVWAPASTVMGGVLAFNDQVGAEWFAPAGLNRGGVANVLRAERKLSQADRDKLYEGNVNPLATFPGNGVVVFGQKTLQRRATALDRVNVRRLLISLKDFIGQVANNLVFEQNTTITRNRFLSQVNPFLDSVVQRQGLFAYKVVMDDSNNTPDVIDRNQLVGQIYIQPTKTAEFIILNFNVLPTGATFPA
jgi:phage tail sheath protein FI